MRHKRRYNLTLGFYMPSMFHLHVHTEENFKNWRKWDDETLCTFLHEYIHFLQDVSTVSGLHNIYVMGECLSDRITRIYKMSEKKIKVPLPLVQGPNNVWNNNEVSNAVEGAYDLDGVDEDTLQVAGKASVNDTLWNLNGQTITMHEVRVPYVGGDFVLGNIHISESMAYIGEQIVYGGKPGVVQPPPNYPYDVVRQLAHFYSPKLEANLPLLFCICDFALTYNPSGYVLVNMFEHYVNEGCPLDWRKFMLDTIKNVKSRGTTGLVSYADGLRQIKDLAIDSLDKRFNHYTYNDIRQWYNNVINRAVGMRLEFPLFIYDFLSGGELKNNKQFMMLLKGVGIPVLTNDFYKTSFTTKINGCHLKKRRAEYMIAAGSITFALGDGYLPCELRKICRAEHRCVDKNCVRAPWKHARRVNPCPYGHLWYGWALKDRELEW